MLIAQIGAENVGYEGEGVEHEGHRINRVRIAKYIGKFPHEVDELSTADYTDILGVMWGDAEVSNMQKEKASGKGKTTTFGG